jgi:hypothetical protein
VATHLGLHRQDYNNHSRTSGLWSTANQISKRILLEHTSRNALRTQTRHGEQNSKFFRSPKQNELRCTVSNYRRRYDILLSGNLVVESNMENDSRRRIEFSNYGGTAKLPTVARPLARLISYELAHGVGKLKGSRT